jgi:hypothetical protein
MQTPAQVEGLGRIAAVAAATLLSCGLHGCTDVTGGAVELSWHLETIDGDTISGCAWTTADDQREAIESIRLTWTPVDASTPPGWRDFTCSHPHGVTSFDVPTGAVLLSVEPLCVGGTGVKAELFTAPPPIERDVRRGDVVELHAVIIQVDTNTACKPSQ